MSKESKRSKAIHSKVDPQKHYPVGDALTLVKSCATAKFDESVDVAVVLGIDAKKSDQSVRGSVVLPAGSGKTKRVAVFAQGAKAEEAKAAGADVVGLKISPRRSRKASWTSTSSLRHRMRCASWASWARSWVRAG